MILLTVLFLVGLFLAGFVGGLGFKLAGKIIK